MTARDRARLANYARHHAEAEATYLAQARAADPAAAAFAEYHRVRRLEIEAELQADADHAGRLCLAPSLPLFD